MEVIAAAVEKVQDPRADRMEPLAAS